MAYDDSQDGGNQDQGSNDPYGADKRKAVADMYQTALGRAASAKEIQDQLQGGSGDMATIHQGIYGSDEAKQYSQKQSSGAGSAKGPVMPDGIDPRLAAVYTKAGMTPGGDKTGFADWQYWQGKMNSGDRDAQYYLDRLGADLNGTGTDDPTGTLGRGIWDKSGPGPSSGVGSSFAPPPAMTAPGQYSPQMGYGPSMNTPNSFWQGRSAQDLANGSSGIGSSSTNDPTGIIAALMKRIGLNSAGIQFNKG